MFWNLIQSSTIKILDVQGCISPPVGDHADKDIWHGNHQATRGTSMRNTVLNQATSFRGYMATCHQLVSNFKVRLKFHRQLFCRRFVHPVFDRSYIKLMEPSWMKQPLKWYDDQRSGHAITISMMRHFHQPVLDKVLVPLPIHTKDQQADLLKEIFNKPTLVCLHQRILRW